MLNLIFELLFLPIGCWYQYPRKLFNGYCNNKNPRQIIMTLYCSWFVVHAYKFLQKIRIEIPSKLVANPHSLKIEKICNKYQQ